jgi:ABC-2 type transport system ATP-binding protein
VPVVSWRDATGVLREQRTERPARLVAELCGAADAAGEPGGEPAELEVRRPSLEQIYLGLIERTADGSAADAGEGGGRSAGAGRSAASADPAAERAAILTDENGTSR